MSEKQSALTKQALELRAWMVGYGAINRAYICWAASISPRRFRLLRAELERIGKPIVASGAGFIAPRSAREHRKIVDKRARVLRAAGLAMLRSAAALRRVSLSGELRQMALEEALREREA